MDNGLKEDTVKTEMSDDISKTSGPKRESLHPWVPVNMIWLNRPLRWIVAIVLIGGLIYTIYTEVLPAMM